MSAKVRIEVDLDEKGAVRGVQNLDESFEQVNSEVKHLKQNSSGTFGGMAGDMFKGMIAADLLMRGISVLIDGVKRLAVGFQGLRRGVHLRHRQDAGRDRQAVPLLGRAHAASQ